MSKGLAMMAAATLMIGVANPVAAAQFVELQTAGANRCQDVQGFFDRTCLGSSCKRVDFAHGQRTVGPTFPTGCQYGAV